MVGWKLTEIDHIYADKISICLMFLIHNYSKTLDSMLDLQILYGSSSKFLRNRFRIQTN